jgi:hypothetical protein
MPELLGSLQVTPGEGHGQREFQFFKLMFTLGWTGGLAAAVSLERGPSIGRAGCMTGSVG